MMCVCAYIYTIYIYTNTYTYLLNHCARTSVFVFICIFIFMLKTLSVYLFIPFLLPKPKQNSIVFANATSPDPHVCPRRSELNWLVSELRVLLALAIQDVTWQFTRCKPWRRPGHHHLASFHVQDRGAVLLGLKLYFLKWDLPT